MAFSVYPGSSNTFRDEWPLLNTANGIVGDVDGSSFSLSPSGSSPEVTIGAGQADIAGFAGISDADVTLDLSSVAGATEPTTGQKRVDLVVARYDWAEPLDTAFSVDIRAGSPVDAAVSDDAAEPSPEYTVGTVAEVPLWRVSRPAGGVVTASKDLRRWATRSPLYLPEGATLPTNAPLGTMVLGGVGGLERLRGLRNGLPAWLERAVVPTQLTRFGPFATPQNVFSGDTDQLSGGVIQNAPRGLLNCKVYFQLRSPAGGRAGLVFVRVNNGSASNTQRWHIDDLVLEGKPTPTTGFMNFDFDVESPGGTVEIRSYISVDSTSGDVDIARGHMTVQSHAVRWV